MTTGCTTEPAEFEALVREGQQAVTRYLLARTGSAAEAAELAQETFVRAYCAMSEGDRPRHPLPWLLAIARNVFLEAVRSARYQRQLTARMGRLMGMEWQSPWQEQVESRLVVGEAVDNLPPELREPVLLHYFAGLTIPEVAGHLEITPAAAKTRLYRARQALRGELETLVSDAKKAVFVMPRELAERAKEMAERPAVYGSLSVGLQVGGLKWGTMPMFNPVHDGSFLSLADLEFAIRRVHEVRLAGPKPLAHKVELWPYFEPFDHPDPLAVLSLISSGEVGNDAFRSTEEGHLEITDGWRLGTDPEAPRLLADLKRADLRHVWFTFAGLEQTHDELCRQPGAFAAIIAAMQRCREAGIETGANLILSKRNPGEVRELGQLIRSLGGERFIPLYTMAYSPEWPEYEEIRPKLEDLRGLPPGDVDANWGYPDFWADPASGTEGALTRAALESKIAPTPASTARDLHLWVAPNLNLFLHGREDRHVHRIANLRTDAPQQVHTTLAGIAWPALPPLAELAEKYGDASSQRVFMRSSFLRRKWLYAWKEEEGVEWLPFGGY